MLRLPRLLPAGLLVLALGACATAGNLARLQPGFSTEADATRLAGPPVLARQNADGTRTLDYSDQPRDGNISYRVVVDAKGTVLKATPILVDPEKVDIKPGMSMAEVEELLGPPRYKGYFPFTEEDIWDWNAASRSAGNLVIFNVHFKQGKVVRTTQRVLDPNDCSVISPC